jgi:hypothetical protein
MRRVISIHLQTWSMDRYICPSHPKTRRVQLHLNAKILSRLPHRLPRNPENRKSSIEVAVAGRYPWEICDDKSRWEFYLSSVRKRSRHRQNQIRPIHCGRSGDKVTSFVTLLNQPFDQHVAICIRRIGSSFRLKGRISLSDTVTRGSIVFRDHWEGQCLLWRIV